MSEAKFTKGPWKLSVDKNGGKSIESCDSLIIADCKYSQVTPENEADYDLIAAAPEMYEAMQEFVNRVDRGEVRSAATYNKFKTILAKARGEL